SGSPLSPYTTLFRSRPNPPCGGARQRDADAPEGEGTFSKTFGVSSSFIRDGGQYTAQARPRTASSEIVPEYLSLMKARESRDATRWSPMTHSRPFGTFTSKDSPEA